MRLLVALIALILGLHFLRENIVLSVLLSLLFLIFIFCRFGPKRALLFFSLFVLGASFRLIPFSYNPEDHTYQGVVISSKENYFLISAHGERFYVYEKENLRQVGDVVCIVGSANEIKRTTYESQLDFPSYLKNKGVSREISFTSIETKWAFPFRIKATQKKFVSSLDEDAASLVDAVMFNSKDYRSDVVGLAKSVNLIFLLSTSGIYFSLIFRTLKKLIFIKFDDRESHILSLIITAPYVIFSFPKVGVLRVFLNNTHMVPLPKGQERKFGYLTHLALTHLILLVFNPYWAYDGGFLLGLGLSVAVFFIRRTYTENRYKRKSRILLPTFVYLFMLPVSSFQSGSFHFFIYPFQVMFTPVTCLFISVAFIGYLGFPCSYLINLFGKGIKYLLVGFNFIDLSIPFADYGPLVSVIYYFLIFLFILMLDMKLYRQSFVLGLVGFSLVFISVMPLQPIVRNAVYFVNVGQGDCIIIQNHFHAVMIDTGGNKSFDMAEETLIPFMNKKQIFHLDALITTHDDFDHSGASDSLMKNFPVHKRISEPESFPYEVGDIKLDNLNIYGGDDENATSLVLTLDFIGKKFLFTGDAPIEVEKQIIHDHPELDCDILKVGHHGSKTSSCREFIETISPEEAIISCGAKNSYGHPNQEVLNILDYSKVKIRRTDQEGTISYVSLFGL